MSTSTSTNRLRKIAASVAAAGVVLFGLGSAASPASADIIGGSSAVINGPTVGTVGVPMTMSITINDVNTPGGSATVTPQGSNSGAAAAITVTNVISGQTQNFTFVPPHVGSFTFNVNGVSSVTSTTVQVQPVSVNVNISAPNTIRVGQAVNINATVTPTSGILAPAGTIQFAIVGSGNIGQPVWLNTGSPSTASISWTPGALGSVQFTATYTPNRINGFPDTSCVNSNCTSPVDTIQVTGTGVNVFLTNPPQFFVGIPNTITAQVSVVPPYGSVSFLVNGQTVAANVPVQSNGQAAFSWTPPAAGTYTINANWVGNNGVTGGSQEQVTVGQGTGLSDSIVLTPAGQASWTPGGTYQVANGVTLNFTGASSSGAPVSISDKGPCNVSGMSLTADQGNGGCILTATTPGGNGFGPGNATYTIQLIPGTQVPATNPPASGRFPVGRVLTLERANQQDTNAGQMIEWRVRPNSRSICQLRFPNNGAVTLRLNKRGACNIVGRAPAVAGQWNKMEITRSYQVR